MDKKASTHVSEVSPNGEKVGENSEYSKVKFSAFIGILLGTILGMGLAYWAREFERAWVESHPKFLIEAITASNINISSSLLPPYYSSLSAQNLTINFVVENPAPSKVEYTSAVVLISYKGDIIWTNTLGLYFQEKKDITSIQVPFSNLPVMISGDDVAKEMSTSGYGVFTVDIKGKYNSIKLKVHCGDVKIHKFSSSFTQETTTGMPKKCSNVIYYS